MAQEPMNREFHELARKLTRRMGRAQHVRYFAPRAMRPASVLARTVETLHDISYTASSFVWMVNTQRYAPVVRLILRNHPEQKPYISDMPEFRELQQAVGMNLHMLDKRKGPERLSLAQVGFLSEIYERCDDMMNALHRKENRALLLAAVAMTNLERVASGLPPTQSDIVQQMDDQIRAGENARRVLTCLYRAALRGPQQGPQP